MAGSLTLSTLKDDTGVLAVQNGMSGIAKAWVNFNGSTGAIRAAFNVGSITKNGTGDYTANFTTAMPDANYGYALSGKHTTSVIIPTTVEHNSVSPTTSALRIQTWNGVSSQADPTVVCVTIFR